MKIAVYGATGMVGSQIVAEAARRGHEVTAISRKGAPVEGAAVVRAAELADAETYREIADANDAVVLATSPDRTGGSREPYIDAHRAISKIPTKARLYMVGGFGGLKTPEGTPIKDTEGFPAQYKGESDAVYVAYEALRDADADLTVQAPAAVIAPGQRTGKYVTAVGVPAPGETISSQDYAVAALDELEQPQFRGKFFTASN
ncbi:putative epimerase/dehydratase [Sinomonas cyclohexanicum]|uniref:Epimerase/dehydratase n=1 Tax=Sinomonas cyclohexanicum TaxID=322009 RepID=A0ABN6FD66_SINCY|nr:NAD(P)H-binding protein [Corynebacterium cyclohexanicum]BCT74876.1 putative epimerase/dehydratase [Corynebacterium cyclohexanicum]